MRRKHACCIWQLQQPVVQRVIELAGQGLGGEVGIGGGEKVGATDVPDEQRVAGENSVRNTSPGCSYTTMQIDSGVCPGVAMISSVTSPSESRCPSRQRLDRETRRVAPAP